MMTCVFRLSSGSARVLRPAGCADAVKQSLMEYTKLDGEELHFKRNGSFHAMKIAELLGSEKAGASRAC